MSIPRHPVTLYLKQQVEGATRLLATVMGLPFIDGIFSAFITMGALATTAGDPSATDILQTGLLIFGRSATVAVTLIEIDGTRREQLMSIPLLGVLLTLVTVAEVIVAETTETLLNFEVFHRFTGLAILAVATKTASSKVGEYLPSPSIIVSLGLVTNFKSVGFELIVTLDPIHLLSAGAAAGTGVGFAGAVALFAPQLRGNVDIDLFRFGSPVALGMLAPDVLGLMPTQTPAVLDVLAITALFALDPDSDDADLDGFVDGASAIESVTSSANTNGAVVDGGDDADPVGYGASVDDANETDNSSEPEYGCPGKEESRVPWL